MKEVKNNIRRRKINTSYRSNSIKTQLVIGLIFATLIPLSLLGVLSYRKSFEILENKLKITTQQTITEVDHSLEEFFKSIEAQVSIASLSSGVQSISEDDSALAMELFQNIIKHNSESLNIYVGTADGSMFVYPDVDLGESYDPRKRDWYQGAIQRQNEVYWSSPYVDQATGEVVVTASRKVVKDGDLVGVLGIDLNLEVLSTGLAQIVIGKEGYIFIVDPNGVVIAHAKKGEIGVNIKDKLSIWDEVEEDPDGFRRYTFDGKKKFMSYTTNQLTGWKLAASMDEEELLRDTRAIKRSTLFCLLFGVVLALAVSSWIVYKITRSLATLKEAFVSASEGDLSTRVETTSRDEFGEIGGSFNTMLGNINELVRVVKNSTSTVLEASGSLAQVIDQATNSVEEVTTTVEDIAKSSSEQAMEIEQGVIEINQLSKNIEKVARSGRTIERLAGATDKLTDSGLEMMKGLTKIFEENKDSSYKVSVMIENVDHSSDEIDQITQAIEDIAEQTNLLALNAAIEAARAGEHGRGFGVVAEEVRKLAEESAQATNRVKELIDRIQSQSKSAVQAIQHNLELTKEQDEAVESTEKIFGNIRNGVKKLTKKAQGVKEEGLEMETKKDQIVQIVEHLAAISEEASAATEQVSANTEEQLSSIEELSSYAQKLYQLSENLQEAVNRFKIVE